MGIQVMKRQWAQGRRFEDEQVGKGRPGPALDHRVAVSARGVVSLPAGCAGLSLMPGQAFGLAVTLGKDSTAIVEAAHHVFPVDCVTTCSASLFVSRHSSKAPQNPICRASFCTISTVASNESKCCQHLMTMAGPELRMRSGRVGSCMPMIAALPLTSTPLGPELLDLAASDFDIEKLTTVHTPEKMTLLTCSCPEERTRRRALFRGRIPKARTRSSRPVGSSFLFRLSDEVWSGSCNPGLLINSG
jgi:hypothetical protein